MLFLKGGMEFRYMCCNCCCGKCAPEPPEEDMANLNVDDDVSSSVKRGVSCLWGGGRGWL